MQMVFGAYPDVVTHVGDEAERIRQALRAFEIKWNPAKAKRTLPSAFASAYPNATATIVSRDNYAGLLA